MKKSKLIQILETFSKKEIKDFEKFVISPYFNTGRNADGLFSILKGHHPDFESDEILKENIFKKLFPGEKYNEKKLKNVTSGLTRLAEQFHVFESIKNDPVHFEELLGDKYRDLGNDKLLNNTLNSLEKKIDGLLFDSVSSLRKKEKAAGLREDYYMLQNRFDKAIALRSEVTEYFMLSFLIRLLRKLRDREWIPDSYSNSLESPLLDVIYEEINIEKILSGLRKRKYNMLWLLEMYYYTYKSATDLDDEESFYKFKKLFNDNIKEFTRREKYFLLADFLSFYIRNFNRGNLKYEREEFELYRQMMEENAFTASDEDYIIPVLFRSIMFVSLSLEEYDWLEEFLDKFAVKLHPEYRDNMKSFVKAHIYSAKGDFEKALEQTVKIKYDLFVYKLDVKNLLLTLYYELDLFDQASALIDTYKHFLNESKEFSQKYLLEFRNYIKIYTKLFKAKADGKTKDLDLLVKEMNGMELLARRPWLTEKVTQLKK